MLSFALTYQLPGADRTLQLEAQLPAGLHILRGPSGAGKSTMLRILAGALRPTAGFVRVDEALLSDTDTRHHVPAHLREMTIVLQEPALFPHLNVIQNVAYGVPQRPRRAREDEARRWLERSEAQHLAQRWPATLSGGEAQRIALARAFAMAPRVLLLDEPFASLDAPLRRRLLAMVTREVQRLGLYALLVTHDEELRAPEGGVTLRMA